MIKITSYDEALKAASLEDCIAQEVIEELASIATSDYRLWNYIRNCAEKEARTDVAIINLRGMLSDADDLASQIEMMNEMMYESDTCNTINRECSGTFLFAIDGINNEQDAQTLMKRVRESIYEQYGGRLIAIEEGDSTYKDSNGVFFLDYGYDEEVSIILGRGGSYMEPPEPDEYDMVDSEDKAWEMGKELQKVFEDLGYTVGDWVIEENRVEDENRLDDKRRIQDTVYGARNYLVAGGKVNQVNVGEYGVKIEITRDEAYVPASEDSEAEYDLFDIKVIKGGDLVGKAENVPSEELESALWEIHNGETRVKGKELLFYPSTDGELLSDAIQRMEKKNECKSREIETAL